MARCLSHLDKEHDTPRNSSRMSSSGVIQAIFEACATSFRPSSISRNRVCSFNTAWINSFRVVRLEEVAVDDLE